MDVEFVVVELTATRFVIYEFVVVAFVVVELVKDADVKAIFPATILSA